MIKETPVQQQIRLEASRRGMRLWRNNNGAVTTEDGRHVRFGIGNESAAINKEIKSSDLIGITPVIVTPDMVGLTHGVFTAIEVKRQGWTYTATAREVAQWKFIKLVESLGGIGYFSTGGLL